MLISASVGVGLASNPHRTHTAADGQEHSSLSPFLFLYRVGLITVLFIFPSLFSPGRQWAQRLDVRPFLYTGVGGKLLAAALPHFILRYKRNSVHIGRERDTTRGEISRPPPPSFPVCVGTRTQARVIRNVQEEKGPFFMIYTSRIHCWISPFFPSSSALAGTGLCGSIWWFIYPPSCL